MSIQDVLEFILLPCVGWLLLTSNKNAARLSRIETLLEVHLPKHPKPNNNED